MVQMLSGGQANTQITDQEEQAIDGCEVLQQTLKDNDKSEQEIKNLEADIIHQEKKRDRWLEEVLLDVADRQLDEIKDVMLEMSALQGKLTNKRYTEDRNGFEEDTEKAEKFCRQIRIMLISFTAKIDQELPAMSKFKCSIIGFLGLLFESARRHSESIRRKLQRRTALLTAKDGYENLITEIEKQVTKVRNSGFLEHQKEILKENKDYQALLDEERRGYVDYNWLYSLSSAQADAGRDMINSLGLQWDKEHRYTDHSLSWGARDHLRQYINTRLTRVRAIKTLHEARALQQAKNKSDQSSI